MIEMPKLCVLFIDIDEEENKQLTDIYDVVNIPTLMDTDNVVVDAVVL